MRYEQCISHYGSLTDMAKALGVPLQTASSWRHGIPPLRQLQIERATKGKLRADADVFTRRYRKKTV